MKQHRAAKALLGLHTLESCDSCGATAIDNGACCGDCETHAAFWGPLGLAKVWDRAGLYSVDQKTRTDTLARVVQVEAAFCRAFVEDRTHLRNRPTLHRKRCVEPIWQVALRQPKTGHAQAVHG